MGPHLFLGLKKRLEKEINDLLAAIGMGDNDCDVEAFISPPEEDQVNDIMTFFWVTNTKATLTLSLLIGRWKKC